MIDASNKATESIESLFKSENKIRIPAYQRSYSWEEKQCSQFLEDLIDQRGKRYYLGQLLFEKNCDTLFIIDGQQRLTTIIIFMSVIAKIKEKKGVSTEDIKQTYLNDIFKTIDDDQIIFKKITQKHLISQINDTETISQKRIISAFSFFYNRLADFDNESLDSIQRTLNDSIISTFYISDKIEATQVFEYQNNRGKELSKFEVIKAYLMHQIYIHSNDNIIVNNDITEIQGVISLIYRHIESVEGYFSENELLDNYCNLFYNIDGNIDAIKERLTKEDNKVSWIKIFFENFAELTLSAKSIISNKHQTKILNLFLVGNNANWKLVLLALFCKGENAGDKYDKILKLLEILCFKLKLGDYRTDYLPNYAKQYFNQHNSYNFDNLYQDIKNVTTYGFKWYWNNNEFFQNIISFYFEKTTHHYNRNTIKFILWQYENQLRIKNRAGALLDKDLYNEYTIEHIKPQHPKEGEYTEEFTKAYLHLAGNLCLLTQSQNSRFANKSFEEKKELFKDTALSSYAEIVDKKEWDQNEILNRHKLIVDFVKEYLDTLNL